MKRKYTTQTKQKYAYLLFIISYLSPILFEQVHDGTVSLKLKPD